MGRFWSIFVAVTTTVDVPAGIGSAGLHETVPFDSDTTVIEATPLPLSVTVTCICLAAP